jgi:hypothetical protein
MRYIVCTDLAEPFMDVASSIVREAIICCKANVDRENDLKFNQGKKESII